MITDNSEQFKKISKEFVSVTIEQGGIAERVFKMRIDLAKIEVLKVWYSVFCTLMDATDYSDETRLQKLRTLRAKLASTIPEVEAEMAKSRM